MSAISKLLGGAASTVEGVATAGIAPLLPWILGIAAAVFAALFGTIGVYHYITVPHLEAEVATDKAAVAVANGQTAQANSTIATLKAQIADQNAQISALQAKADTAQSAAVAAGDAALKVVQKPLPLPPADKSAASVNAYWNALVKP